MTLTFRKTEIGGDVLEDDYCIFDNGERVGRIRLAVEQRHNGTIWNWHVNPPRPVPAWGNGRAGSFDEAKAAWRDAWERYNEKSPPPS